MVLVNPLIIPLFTALICIISNSVPRGRSLRTPLLSLSGTFVHFLVTLNLASRVWHSGIFAIQVGDWPAPFGITLVADLLSAAMVLITGFLGFAVHIFAMGKQTLKSDGLSFYPAYHFLLMGVCGAFLTGDLFNLYVWFEVLLISSFVLMVQSGSRASLAGSMKYVALSLFSSALFLSGLAVLYNSAGTLNMADLSLAIRQESTSQLTTVAGTFILLAFMIKAAVFPLFFWLPASYHTPSIPTAALFAGLLTKVGVYALIRMVSLHFADDPSWLLSFLVVVSGWTMLIGVLGAAAQYSMRRVLSFHIISQIGYMTLGLAIFTASGLAGSIFYLIHHIIVKTNLFLVTGAVERVTGSSDLKSIGNVKGSHPWLALGFAIPALSLAGMPPLSGFWAKLIVIQASLEVQRYWVTGVALVVGLLTLFSMTKIWAEVFWKKSPEDQLEKPPLNLWERVTYILPITLMCLWTLAMGLGAEQAFQYSQRAALQLLDPPAYIDAVFMAGKLSRAP